MQGFMLWNGQDGEWELCRGAFGPPSRREREMTGWDCDGCKMQNWRNSGLFTAVIGPVKMAVKLSDFPVQACRQTCVFLTWRKGQKERECLDSFLVVGNLPCLMHLLGRLPCRRIPTRTHGCIV